MVSLGEENNMIFKKKCIAFIDSKTKPGTCDHYRKNGVCRFILSAHCDDIKSDEIKIKIKKATVLIKNGTDLISLIPDWETPFPEMNYPPSLDMEVRKGYGIEYCRRVIGIEPEIINSEKGKK